VIRKTFIAAMVMLVAGAVYAANYGKGVTMTGYLIDNACAGKNASNPDKIKGHSVSCALMDPCIKSGYSIYSDGKLYKLDKAGNDQAETLLKNTTSKTSPQVKVEGDLSGDTLKVKSISETM
jgi:hypothetical protein